MIALNAVKDATFAGEYLGKGVAIEPEEGRVVAPFDGKVTVVMDTKHAVGMTSDNGIEVLIHVGMDTVQLKGVDSTNRVSSAKLADGATLIIKEKIMTHGKQTAETSFEVELEGKGSSANLISRSVAKDNSKQVFRSIINGNSECYGHSECDAIIMDHGVVAAIPEITANHIDATLIHEAAIGKIAGDQLTKLMTLGLTEKEAQKQQEAQEQKDADLLEMAQDDFYNEPDNNDFFN